MIPKVGKVIRSKKVNKLYQRRTNDFDFLKNWAIVRRWAVINYELKSLVELETILFLYSEKLFTRTQYENYSNFLYWDRNRFKKLLDEGWIYIWRKRGFGETNLYEVSHKGKKMVNTIYKKLLGLEPIPESSRNKVFRKTAPFSQKTLAIAIKQHNKDLKERKQRPSPELQ